MAYVDFTNPAAVAWYQGELRKLIAMGVDAFKTDFGEEIPTDVVYHDGADPALMHNYYTYLYNRAVFSLLEAERGVGEAVVFARSATATCQRFPVHWAATLRQLRLHGGEPPRRALARRSRGRVLEPRLRRVRGPGAAGGLQALGRLRPPVVAQPPARLELGAVPWAYDEEAVDVLRRFTERQSRLMPYLMAAAVEAHEASIPMMRAMVLECPETRLSHPRPAVLPRSGPPGRAGLPRAARGDTTCRAVSTCTS
jgi:alpha-D-xyloside xylohydrolase